MDGSIDRQNNRNKKAGPKARKKIQFSDLQSPPCDETYACGEGVGLALGGHGVGFIPGELLPLPLPWFPGAEGFELDDPVLGSAPGVPFAVPGKGRQWARAFYLPGAVVGGGAT